MEDIVELIKHNFPVLDRQLAFHDANLFLTLSIMKVNWDLEGFLCERGKPKLLFKSFLRGQSSLVVNRAQSAKGVLGENRSLDFRMFMVWPDVEQNRFKVSTIASSVLWFAFPKRIRSSANRRWDMEREFIFMLNGVHFFSSHSWWINFDSHFIHIMKYTERGDPLA